MRGFVDERDGGAMFVTHIFLLVGCGIPVFLSNGLGTQTGAMAGILSIGVGDAVASIMGSR